MKERISALLLTLVFLSLSLIGSLSIHAAEVPPIATYVEAVNTNRFGYVWPIEGPVSGRYMSQAFKYSGNAKNTDHNAIDIAAPAGTEIVATTSGTVVCASTFVGYCSTCGDYMNGAGCHVVIKHTDGYYSMYAHMSTVSVSSGKTVTAGQRIGAVGSTGNSDGNHLHFAIYQKSGAYVSFIDPLAKLTPFADTYIESMTSSNATLRANFGVMGIPFSSEGFYIGTSKTGLHKITDSKGTGYNYIGNQIQYINFNLNEYYGTLTNGTKYYIQFWLNHNGNEYKSDLYSFVAGGANSYVWEEEAVAAPTVSISYTSYDEKYSIGTDNAVLAGTANITNATNLDVDMAGILLYDHKGTQIASKTEDTTNVSTFYGENFVKIWYDVKNRLGYTLSPGTTYQYKFFIEIFGTKYYSPLLSFTTNGTHSHAWDDGSVTKVPSCSQSGEKTFSCLTCSETKTETLPATGNHTAGEWELLREATCTDAGIQVQRCTVCDSTINTESLPAAGHDYTSLTVDATCIENGKTTHTCKNCGDTYSDPIPATGNHSLSDWQVTAEATCTATGTKIQSCSVCGVTVNTESLPAARHDYTSSTVDATCIEDGKTTHTCKNCGDSYSDSIPATGHDYVSASQEATCTQTGNITYTCSQCGHSYSEHISALNHNYQNGTCTRCGAINSENKPSCSHEYSITQTAATCLEDGVKLFTCSKCGDHYSERIPANGHRYSSITTEASCSKEGKIVYTCRNCEHSYTKTIPPTGKHTFGSWAAVSASMHKRFCTVCQISEEASHRWDQGTITLAPTETKNGIKTYTCSDCSSTREESLSPFAPAETTVTSDSEPVTEIITTEENESETIPVTTESTETDNVVPSTDYIESTTDTIDVIETEPDDVTTAPIESMPFSDEETYTPRPTETTNVLQTDDLDETPINRALVVDVIIFTIGMIGCGIAFLLSKRNRR